MPRSTLAGSRITRLPRADVGFVALNRSHEFRTVGLVPSRTESGSLGRVPTCS